MQLNMENLPGDITHYYHMIAQSSGDFGDIRYTIGYYWTLATSLAGANSYNTYRVDAENATNSFERVFGATIEVPNLINRLFVQKFDEDGNPVNNTHFSMYEVIEAKGAIYYVANGGTLIYLDADADGDNKGTAKVGTYTGSYVVDGRGTGNITVTMDGGTIYTIEAKPYVNGGRVAITTDNTYAGESGTAYFTNMKNGTYYVREISAPEGYKLNFSEVMVLVNDVAVYANAGTVDDGVTVARGPGYVVSSLHKFASDGVVDNTLTWIYERMRISSGDAKFSDFDNYENWGYLKENYDPNPVDVPNALTVYLKYDTSEAANTLFNYTVNEDRYIGDTVSSVTRRLYTSVGWSYYEIYQDYDYGEKKAAENGASYDNLGTQEIANLFSRSAYIQVTDEKNCIVINKQDNVTNAPLAGAEFILSYDTENDEGETITHYFSGTKDSDTGEYMVVWTNNPAEAKNLTSDADGKISLFGLGDYTYTMSETKAPEGYLLPESQITFTVAGGVITYCSLAADNYESDSITVYNSTGTRLPETGSTGTKPYTYGGLLLMTAAMMCEYILRRKAKRRCEG